MNDFSDLENQLRKLQPAQPSLNLIVRVERELAEQETLVSTAGVLPRERRLHLNWLSLGLGLAAAAALVLFAGIQLRRPATTNATLASASSSPKVSTGNAPPRFVPAGLTQVVYQTSDEGVHFPDNSAQPVRRVRSRTRETLQWRNPKTGATLRISYPTEEVSLLPLSGQ